MPIVSVIVPVYNAEKYIERCVDSIMGQTFKDIELLLIDDGSIDKSGILCDDIALKDKRIKVIHQENGGVSVARNRGIECSKGEWLIFVDADDWIEISMIERMLAMVEDQKGDIGICSFYFEYKDNTKLCTIPNKQTTIKELLKEAMQLEGIDEILCSPCNKIYKKDIIEKNQIRFESDIKFGEDFIFNTRYFVHTTRIIIENTPLYHYDCSIEDSGVKKNYSNFDKYIKAMWCALDTLQNNVGIYKQDTQDFIYEFIGSRWSYATNICIESHITCAEKVVTLYKWFTTVDNEMLQYMSQKTDSFSVFARTIIQRGKVTIGLIRKTFLIIFIKRKTYSLEVKIKRKIKKMFGGKLG